MSEIVAIVEGQTEQTFVERLLARHLGAQGISMWARLPGRVRRRGGVPAWESVRGDVLRTLKERRGRICTTMFDFFRMPFDWPGRNEARDKPWHQRGSHVEQALLRDVREHAGEDFRQGLFVPYVQVHEFEALLFSDVARLAEVGASLGHAPVSWLQGQFEAIRQEAGSPEAINDGQDTAPSKRIGQLVSGYRKRLHGPIVAARIGLAVLREACPHFGEWLTRLEALGAQGQEQA